MTLIGLYKQVKPVSDFAEHEIGQKTETAAREAIK